MDSSSRFIIQVFCVLITIAIFAAVFFLHFYDWDNIFDEIHIFIAVIFALSGFLICFEININITSMAKHLYFVAGTLSWYGVLYCYISAETSIEIHHYVQPEILIAFLTFAGTLLTFSEIDNVKSYLKNFKYNSQGIIFLLFYLWINEIYDKDYKNDLFLRNVMKQLPPHLTLFSDHRISYSIILISCHYCSIIFLWFFIGDGEKTPQHDDENFTSDKILKEKLNQRRNQIGKSKLSSHDLSLKMNNDIKNASTKNMNNTMKNKDINQSQSEFPEDCVEISHEDAALLTGDDYSMVDNDSSDRNHGV